MMKFRFILKSGLLLSFAGIIAFFIRYISDPNPNAFLVIAIKIIASSTLVIFFIRHYVLFELEKDAFPGFIKYLLNFVAILFLSTTIHFTAQYLIYNHLDTDYKYDVEEQYYQKERNNNIKKGLPLPHSINDEEVEYKYGIYGLMSYFKAYYILDIIVLIIFYLFAVLFYKIKTDS